MLKNFDLQKFSITEVSNINELQNAIKNESEIKLIANIDVEKKISISKKITIDLNGHEIVSSGKIFQIDSQGDLTVTDSDINKKGKIFNNSSGVVFSIKADGILNIEGGNFISSLNVAIKNEGGTVNINGGTISGSGNAFNNSSGIFIITNGNFNGTIKNSGSLKITGGIFNTDISDYLESNYTIFQNEDGTYSPMKVTSQIGENKYKTLTLALEAVSNDDTIKLLDDVEENINVRDKNIFINLNEKKVRGNVNVENGSIKIDEKFLKVESGSITAEYLNGFKKINGSNEDDNIFFNDEDEITITTGAGNDTINLGSDVTKFTITDFDEGDEIKFFNAVNAINTKDNLIIAENVTIDGISTGTATINNEWELSDEINYQKVTSVKGAKLSEDGTKIIYGLTTNSENIFKISGLKENLTTDDLNDAINIDGNEITLSANILDSNSTVSISSDYNLNLDENVSKSSTEIESWKFENNHAIYQSEKILSGYKIENNQIIYVDTSGGEILIEVDGISSVKNLTSPNENNFVNLNADNFDSAVSIIKNENNYKFALNEGNYSEKIFNGSDDNDTIQNAGSKIIIDGGAGDDSINIVGGSEITIANAGCGNDTINFDENAEVKIKITGGTNQKFSLNDKDFNYSDENGFDISISSDATVFNGIEDISKIVFPKIEIDGIHFIGSTENTTLNIDGTKYKLTDVDNNFDNGLELSIIQNSTPAAPSTPNPTPAPLPQTPTPTPTPNQNPNPKTPETEEPGNENTIPIENTTPNDKNNFPETIFPEDSTGESTPIEDSISDTIEETSEPVTVSPNDMTPTQESTPIEEIISDTIEETLEPVTISSENTNPSKNQHSRKKLIKVSTIKPEETISNIEENLPTITISNDDTISTQNSIPSISEENSPVILVNYDNNQNDSTNLNSNEEIEIDTLPTVEDEKIVIINSENSTQSTGDSDTNKIPPTNLYKNIYRYIGGDDTIKNYHTGKDKIILTSELIGSSLNGNDIILTTNEGTLTIKNGGGKKLIIENSEGNIISQRFPTVESSLHYGTSLKFLISYIFF